MRSCNIWFYHIGLDLFRTQGDHFVSDMARSFGLGSPTGIQGVAEQPGNIQNPTTDDEAVRMAIGQFTVLVTPLQVADFVAAVANGGTLYKPQVIEKIAPLDTAPTFAFKPETRGTLPVSPENLKVVQDAMRSVIENAKGTAHYTFSGMGIPIYGKTGTAQSDKEMPHAWFAAYTAAKREDKPDIAVAVVVEYAGDGSEFAAPMVRRILEVYFEGSPRKLYPWESTYNVTRTPTPLFTDTPVPTDTPMPDSTATPTQ
jgi:penicillin-binding protein 2